MSNQANGSVPMDKDFLLTQVGGSVETAILVLDEFVNQAQSDIESIRKALENENLSDAGKVAHSLKGSSGVLGAEVFRSIAADLEMACRGGKQEESQTLFDQLTRETKRCLDYAPQLKVELK